MTLREQEQCFSELNLILRSYHKSNYLFSEQLIAFSVIKVRYKDLLRSSSTKRNSYQKLIAELKTLLDPMSSPYGSWERFEPHLISWFLVLEEAQHIHHLASLENEKFNKIQSGVEKEEARIKWESLRTTVTAYDEYRRWIRLPSDKSIAGFVWSEFERSTKA